MEIGIVGQGYVGTAIKVGFEPHYDYIHTYDKYDLAKSTLPNIKDLVDKCDVIFVCVPTPMRKDGTCYTGIVEEVIKEIDYNVDVNKDKPIVVIKSTIPPGTTDKFNKSYFVISPDLRDLNYDKYFHQGDKKISKLSDYTSSNTSQLNQKKLEKKILNIIR